MLVKPTVAELLEKGENRYRLVVATAKRARQISAGSEKMIETDEESPVTVAACELKKENVKIYNEEEWKEYTRVRNSMIIDSDQTKTPENSEENNEEN